MRSSSALLLLLSLLAAAPLHAGPGALLDEGQRAILEAGGVVVVAEHPKHGKGHAYRSYGLVDAPPARVWAVVRDCEHLDEYMPRMARAVEFDRHEGSYVCETEIELPFPLSNRVNAARSVLEELPGGVFRRHWSLVAGDWDYLRNDGSWTVQPWDQSGRRTLLEYWLDAWLKSSVPDFIVEAARKVQAPAAYEAIRRRVRSLAVAAGDDDTTRSAGL